MIFLFIDGLGLGEKDSSKNPIYAANAPCMRKLLEHPCVRVTDSCLGVPGLPQSATGQTAIFTGVNAAQVLGRHLSGQPTVTLIKIIQENSLFKELQKRGRRVTNSNVYREEYLKKMLDPKERKLRPSVSTVMCLSSGIPFRHVEEFRRGEGIYHDITGQILKDSGYEVELTTPRDAARRLYHISRDYDFTLYEHFMSDIIGHKTDMPSAVQEIELLDAFLEELLELMDLSEDILMLTSDHGNIEDVTVKTHTKNKVPVLLLGAVPPGTAEDIRTLTDIMPAVLGIFDAL